MNEKAGLTFAAALRSILRQDPDVVLVGEIRDHETAQIAVQASLTGHLVLSTLHTNDAPNAVTRLVDMGMEAYKIATALRGVMAQRLMRRLCPHAARKSAIEAPPAGSSGASPRARCCTARSGCPDCAMTGYRGRFSIVEVLTMNPEIERRDRGAGATADRIAEAARQAGHEVAVGERAACTCSTARRRIEELLRVTDVPPRSEPAARRRSRCRRRRRPARRRGRPDAGTRGPRRRRTPSPPAPCMASRFELLDERCTPIVDDPARPAGQGRRCCWWRTRTSFAG